MTSDRLIEITHPDDPRIAEFRDIRERDLTGRENRFIAEGTVVLRLLAEAHAAGGDFLAEKVLLLQNRVAGLADIIAKFPPEVPVHVATSEVLDGIVGFHLHRGVLALGRRKTESELSAFLDRLPRQALALVGCGISNHDNMGSMFRNAAVFGADAVLLDDSCCDPLYRKALRVSVGSVLTMPYCRQSSDVDLLTALADRGFAIWSLSPRGRPIFAMSRHPNAWPWSSARRGMVCRRTSCPHSAACGYRRLRGSTASMSRQPAALRSSRWRRGSSASERRACYWTRDASAAWQPLGRQG